LLLASLRELWNLPLNDYFVAAAPDHNMRLSHRRAIGLPEDFPYFNSGVLVMNLRKWREDKITEKLLPIAVEIKDNIDFPDQDVLNVYAHRNGFMELPEGWNVHPRATTSRDRRGCCTIWVPVIDVRILISSTITRRSRPMVSFRCRGYGIGLSAAANVLSAIFVLYFFPRKMRRAIRRRFNLR